MNVPLLSPGTGQEKVNSNMGPSALLLSSNLSIFVNEAQ